MDELKSDSDIMLAVKAGDLDRLEELYQKYSRMLFGYFFRMHPDTHVCEDLVQEVFLKVIKYRHTYRGERNRFLGWLLRIAHHTGIDHHRRRRHEKKHADSEELEFHADNQANQGALVTEQQQLLQMALAQLTPAQREVLMMSRIQEMRYEDIAQALNCQVGTVKARIFRAFEKLRRSCNQLERES